MSPFRKVIQGNLKIIAILAVSLLLRWILIFQGGQYYFPDEIRYLNSRGIAAAILDGNFQQAIADLTVSPEHIGYRMVAILPAIPEVWLNLSPVAPAIFFSFFSVLNLYLIWKLAQRTGMSPAAADYALLLAASAQSLMYFSRHLLPYDLSLSFGLFALYLALKKEANLKNSLACGAVSFLCFITYNGYWPLAGFAFFAHALANIESLTESLKKALFFMAGVILCLATLALLSFVGSGSNLISDYLGFAGSVTQGDYAEGWKLPFEYLWHTEHAILLILGGSASYAFYRFSVKNEKKIGLWLGGSLFIYLCLAIPSTFLHLFVVYGRTARQIVPFLVLLAAFGLAQLEQFSFITKKFSAAILILILIQAGWNYFSAYSITYPIEFIRRARAEYSDFAMSQKRTNTGAPAICQHKDYLAVDVKYIHPVPDSIPSIQGDLLLSVPHPLNFLPYQYEGYTPAQRQVIRKEKIEMKLYKVLSNDRFARSDTPVPNCVAANP